MRVLILGGSGFLGAELVRRALDAGHVVTATSATRPGDVTGVVWRRADLRDRLRASEVVREAEPDVVVDTVSRPGDWAATADTAVNAAIAAAAVGARLVFVSSDAVFGGSRTPYPEGARPDPITAYGAAKAAAETAVAAVAPDAVIVRTSLIIGSDGGSVHERRMHDAVAGRAAGVLFTDDIRCPVHVTDLAEALLELAVSVRSGVHHVAGPEAISRYGLGRLIAERDGLDPDALRPGLRAASAVPGPLEVRLSSEVTQRHLSTRIRGAGEFLRR